MAEETIFLSLSGTGTTQIEGDDIAADQDDNQIVYVSDGGTTSGTVEFAFWGKDTPTEPGAGPGGDDVFIFDLSAFDDNFDIVVKSMDAGDSFQFTNWDSWTPPAPGETAHTFVYTGSDGLSHTVTIDAQSTNGAAGVDVVQVMCFAGGTGIGTPLGEVPVEMLQAGDLVTCGDGRSRAIRWIGSRRLGQAELLAHPELRPVRLKAGAMGGGLPRRDLDLSPQHRVKLSDDRAELLFGSVNVLVAADHLRNEHNIRRVNDCATVTYYHILLDGHHTVLAEGQACETMLLAGAGAHALTGAQRNEIAALCPDRPKARGDGATCYPALRRFEAECLLDGWQPKPVRPAPLAALTSSASGRAD